MRWSKRELSAKGCVYYWADGIHVQGRLGTMRSAFWSSSAPHRRAKKRVGLIDGVRRSAHSRRELLLDLKRRGLAIVPELAVADGALSFWQAIEEVWRSALLVRKTTNVLNKLPKKPSGRCRRFG